MTAFIWPLAAVAMVAMVTAAALRAWRGWLELQRFQIAADRAGPDDGNPRVIIEMAAIRDRLRKLEEIATGVDL